MDDELRRARARVHTWPELRATGCSPDALRHRVDSGRWQRLHRGIYLSAAEKPTWPERVWGAILAAGDSALASHATAARLHGLPARATDQRIHVTVVPPHDARPVRGARIVRRTVLSQDVTAIGGLPLTTPLRTVVDCLCSHPFADAVVVTESAVRAGLVLVPDIATSLGALRGARGVARARTALKAIDLRSESPLETVARILLIAAGLPPSDVQLEVRCGGRVYRLDLAYLHARLAIEIDGRAFHSDAADFARDRHRQNALVRAGWTVLRFTAADLSSRPDYVVATVRATLAALAA